MTVVISQMNKTVFTVKHAIKHFVMSVSVIVGVAIRSYAAVAYRVVLYVKNQPVKAVCKHAGSVIKQHVNRV